MTFLGVRHPRSTRLDQADLSDAPAHEITSPALSNQGAGPMKPAVGQVSGWSQRWRSGGATANVTPGHFTPQRKLGLIVNSALTKQS